MRGAVVRSVRHSDRRSANKQQTRAMEKASSCHKHAVAGKRITTLTILLNSLGLNGKSECSVFSRILNFGVSIVLGSTYVRQLLLAFSCITQLHAILLTCTILITVSDGFIQGRRPSMKKIFLLNTHYYSILGYCNSLLAANNIGPIKVHVRTFSTTSG